MRFFRHLLSETLWTHVQIHAACVHSCDHVCLLMVLVAIIIPIGFIGKVNHHWKYRLFYAESINSMPWIRGDNCTPFNYWTNFALVLRFIMLLSLLKYYKRTFILAKPAVALSQTSFLEHAHYSTHTQSSDLHICATPPSSDTCIMLNAGVAVHETNTCVVKQFKVTMGIQMNGICSYGNSEAIK